MNQSKKVLFSLLLVLVVGSIFGNGCMSEEHFIPIDIDVLSISSYFDAAMEEALMWNDDAYIESFETTISINNQHQALIARYSFRSISNPGDWMLIIFDESSAADISTGRFPQGDDRLLPLEIDINQIEIDSNGVIDIALANGGQEFINANHPFTVTMARLEQDNTHLATGDIRWLVAFANSEHTFHMLIDPISGSVVESFSR